MERSALTTQRSQPSTTSPDDRAVAGLIARLLLHFWAGDVSDGARRAMAEDWLEDLREFGPEIVSIACGEWRRQPGGRRPTPGDIRTICIREQHERRPIDRAALPAPDWQERIAAQRAERDRRMSLEGRALANKWARERGFADFDAAQEAGHTHAEVIQSVCAANAPLARHAAALGAAALGVTVREFTATPERLAEDRRALDLEPQPPEETP